MDVSDQGVTIARLVEALNAQIGGFGPVLGSIFAVAVAVAVGRAVYQLVAAG